MATLHAFHTAVFGNEFDVGGEDKRNDDYTKPSYLHHASPLSSSQSTAHRFLQALKSGDHTHHPRRRLVLVKGSIEAILPRCNSMINTAGTAVPLKHEDDDECDDGHDDVDVMQQAVDTLSGQALRVIAVAIAWIGHDDDGAWASLTSTSSSQPLLCFAGVLGIADPEREGVKQSIHDAKNAGIRVIMITGMLLIVQSIL